VNDVDSVPEKGRVVVSMRGRCTLEIICTFKKTFEKRHVEALEGAILKLVLCNVEGVDNCACDGLGLSKGRF